MTGKISLITHKYAEFKSLIKKQIKRHTEVTSIQQVQYYIEQCKIYNGQC